MHAANCVPQATERLTYRHEEGEPARGGGDDGDESNESCRRIGESFRATAADPMRCCGEASSGDRTVGCVTNSVEGLTS